jgi:hypothetical protein
MSNVVVCTKEIVSYTPLATVGYTDDQAYVCSHSKADCTAPPARCTIRRLVIQM